MDSKKAERKVKRRKGERNIQRRGRQEVKENETYTEAKKERKE
jgi:hypothetical protein